MSELKCWICGEIANSKEHIVKRSDLKAVFGPIGANAPLYVHNAFKQNIRAQGLKSEALKFKNPLCAKCNNERSQPYDRAWSQLSAHIRNRIPPVKAGGVVRAYRAFAMNSSEEMRRVQLYFVKLFGCSVIEAKAPINLSSFSSAFVRGKFHKDVFLRFGYVPRDEQIVGLSSLVVAQHPKTGEIAAASFYYELESLSVRVIYTPNHTAFEDTQGSWHPAYSRGRIAVHDFGPLLRVGKEDPLNGSSPPTPPKPAAT